MHTLLYFYCFVGNELRTFFIESMSSSRNSNSGCNTPTVMMPKTESIFEAQLNGKNPSSIDSPDNAKQSAYSGPLNLPGFYKTNKGEILPTTGILLGYITNPSVANGNSVNEARDVWNSKENVINSTLPPSQIEKHIANNFQFSASSEDLSDMPLPPPPESLQYNRTIEHLRSKNAALDPMFCSTFSLDSLPPPPPPIVDSAMEGNTHFILFY